MKREELRLIKSIHEWLQKYRIKGYSLNEDLSIRVNGNVDISFMNIAEFPSYIQFDIVVGYFDCSENKLTSLRGCPREVIGNFYCYNNQLDSIRYCPEEVAGKFFCQGNLRKFSEREITIECDVTYINN